MSLGVEYRGHRERGTEVTGRGKQRSLGEVQRSLGEVTGRGVQRSQGEGYRGHRERVQRSLLKCRLGRRCRGHMSITTGGSVCTYHTSGLYLVLQIQSK